MEEDPFDSILNFEDAIYREAYTLGQRDGARAGLLEGHVFGLEKGFDKFLEMSRLHGRALVWASRLPRLPAVPSNGAAQSPSDAVSDGSAEAGASKRLPPLRPHGRLDRHIHALLELTDPHTLAVENTDDGVAEFDERFRRAVARARIVSRIVGENAGVSAPANGDEAGGQGIAQDMTAQDEGNIEDLDVRGARR